MPARGDMVIFDRSWYGRVLVERVEGFAAREEHERAYREINELERHYTDDNIAILKIWLHVSQEEQLRRFKERADDPFKRYKLTEEGLAQPPALGRIPRRRRRDVRAHPHR